MIIFWLIITGMTLLAMSIVVVAFVKQAPLTAVARFTLPKITILIGLSLALATVAITLYLKLGASPLLAKQQLAIQQALVVQNELQQLGSLKNIIKTLKQKVLAHPDSRGWSLLGRLYLKDQQYKAASTAFAQANALTPNQPEILIAYAESLYFANQLKLSESAKQLLQQALRLQPNQPDALNLLAIDAYSQGNYALAIAHWEQLLPQLPPQSEEQKKLLALLASAQTKLAPKPPTTATRAAIKLVVQVKLAPALKAKINAQDTLFIYAQAVQGPKMPLAIVRKTAADLPVTVQLTQNMAMLPTATLADYPQVKIIARISKSAQPQAAPKDLEGSSSVIEVQHPPQLITVVIDKQLAD